MKRENNHKTCTGINWFQVIPIVFLLFLSACSNSQEPKDINVIFISMDTTRADYIDTGKGARAYTPELRRFAKKSVVFDRAYTTIPITLPSHLAILTSCLPHEMSVLNNEYYYEGPFKLLQEVLGEKGYHTAGVVSLGTLSSRNGFDKGFDEFHENLFDEKTFFVTGDKITDKAIEMLSAAHPPKKDHSEKNKNFFLFLHYSDPHTPYAPPRLNIPFQVLVDGQKVSECNAYHGAILRLAVPLEKGNHTIEFKLDGSMKDFNSIVIRRLRFGTGKILSLQNLTYSEKHYGGSYLLDQPRGKVQVKCNAATDMTCFQVIPLVSSPAAIGYYREEVEFMDKQIGRFLTYLETSKLLKKTAVVIFADHGEGLGERLNYFGHTRYLNQQFIHIPLIVYLPGLSQPGKHIQVPVSTVSISPTILEYLSIHQPQFSRRPSLLPFIEKGTDPNSKMAKNPPIYSFTYAPDSLKDKFSVIRWPYQGIFYLDENSLQVSDKEFYNLSLSQSYTHKDALFADLVKKNSLPHYRFFLNDFVGSKHAFNRKSILARRILADNQTHERLSALGYLR